jgi:hypothetical protein
MASLNDDLAIHRAVYRDAHSRGDPLATARAAARLRAHIADLDAAELAAVRASRQRFGQAIREARSRRLAPPVASVLAGIPLSPPRRFPVALAATFALLVLVIAAVVAEPLLVDQTEGGGGAPATDVSDPVVQPVTLSRGRVILAVAAVEPVAEQTVSATPEPSASGSASPAPSSGASAAPGGGVPGGSGAPGSGTGTGSGGGNGTGSASPAPRPSPTPRPSFAICVGSVPRGFARLCGLVVDVRTGRPIAGACVSLGPCNDQSARTDPNGRWTFTLPAGNGTLIWTLEFASPAYRTTTYKQTSRQGLITIPTQRLSLGP